MTDGLAPLRVGPAPPPRDAAPASVLPLRARLPETAEIAPVAAVLGGLVALNVATLGLGGWAFRPDAVEPTGPLGPLVSAAGAEWSLGAIRAPALLAGVLVALAAAARGFVGVWSGRAALALATAVVLLLLAPAVLLQAGLRDATAPWLFTNDSTYQIELAGGLVADGESPYGHDYEGSGLERFYSLDGSERSGHAALGHFAYFPGTPLAAAAWSALPAPFDDFRFLVLLASIGTLFAVLLFDAPLTLRLAVGAALAANPLAVQAAWFGTADALSLLLVVVAFALVTRSRYGSAAAALAAAVLVKQFALVALPFLAAMLVTRRAGRPAARRAAVAFGGVLLAGFLPFLAADAGAVWRDTIAYGTGTYPILGYGLAPLLLEAGVLPARDADYPFGAAVLLVWLPATLWLLRGQLLSRRLWVGGAGLAVSMLLLLCLARTFHPSYLVWPLAGVALALLLSAAEDGRARPVRSPGPARPG